MIKYCGKELTPEQIKRDDVVIGGKEEGYTTFTKEQFELFMNEVKGGTFDKYLKKD